MEISYSPDQEALRTELRDYYDRLLDDETMREIRHGNSIGPTSKRVWKQMCADGWAGLSWPKEYGGRELDPIEQFIFFDESMRAGAPVPTLTLNTVGPTIMNYGTEWQKDFFLPRILAGDIHFAIGYSEPEAGTDLAALQTRAVRDGDEYVVNGQKMWTSLAGGSDYIWLAVRTDPEVKKHKGISVLIVPLDTPGITLQPLTLMASHDINATFFDDVRVPAKYLVGEENGGWGLITNQLNHERVTLCASGSPERNLTDVRRWAQETLLADGRRVIDQEWVQLNLARVHARLEFLRLANWKVAWSAKEHSLDPADASTVKVFGTEFYLECYRLLMEVLGPRAYVKEDSPAAVLAGRLEAMVRGVVILTFGGGTNELQRDLIAMFGLGFPRSR
ncbi:MAG: acyl-CoA dehydrogenase family protein [Acidimicrobiales bacterium]|jgi:alkylation response protein AidB-like acyl-CoA dehydrogenase|nr:acyl-CoA dehydrogenase family protein [Acidimicrobiales bacterium]